MVLGFESCGLKELDRGVEVGGYLNDEGGGVGGYEEVGEDESER